MDLRKHDDCRRLRLAVILLFRELPQRCKICGRERIVQQSISCNCNRCKRGQRTLDERAAKCAGHSFKHCSTNASALGWLCALLLVVAQVLPFLLLGVVLKSTGSWRMVRGEFHATRQRRTTLLTSPQTGRLPLLARLFRGLGLDLFPALLRVLAGRLWLCGQEPLRVDFDDALRRELKEYFPAALTYATPRAEASDTLIKRVDALYYAHHRALAEDARILLRALSGRFAGLFRGAPEEPTS